MRAIGLDCCSSCTEPDNITYFLYVPQKTYVVTTRLEMASKRACCPGKNGGYHSFITTWSEEIYRKRQEKKKRVYEVVEDERRLTVTVMSVSARATQAHRVHYSDPRVLDRFKRRILTTLDPNRLQESDFVDISFYKNFGLRLRSNIPDSPEPLVSSPLKFSYSWSSRYDKKRLSFPPQSGGFFYYHSPSDLSPLAGSIRFRRTDTSSPDRFSSGVDLSKPNGTPWDYPLHRLARNADASRALIHDGVVTEEILAANRKVFGSRQAFKWTTPLLFHLSQTFSIPRNQRFTSIFVVVNDQLLGPAKISTKSILQEFWDSETDLDSSIIGHAHVRLVQSRYGILGAELLAVQRAANTIPLQVFNRKPVVLKSFGAVGNIEPLYFLARG
ncbi:hypothetical protein D9757_008880 [Collybiopsis confluens]|uniref:Uncharacterized protein n=1 Tax=Collybiopsis confluens TaxID=2823264 RepID=A0A8H5M154_9AGAR|nr:hypothetical protein D9757_008880 [Collybiopsis confluens]